MTTHRATLNNSVFSGHVIPIEANEEILIEQRPSTLYDHFETHSRTGRGRGGPTPRGLPRRNVSVALHSFVS